MPMSSEERKRRREWEDAPTNPRLPGEILGVSEPGVMIQLSDPADGDGETYLRIPKNVATEVGRPGAGVDPMAAERYAVQCQHQDCGFERVRESEAEVASDAIDHRHETGHDVQRASPGEFPGESR